MKRILITGAAGGVGTILRKEFAGKYKLRLSDISDVGDLRSNEEFISADLGNGDDVAQIVKGVDAIVHLGGYAVEGPWEPILNANIIGTYNLYELAYKEGIKRIVFASSNHAVGFYKRTQIITHEEPTRPDSRYGVSKVFGEAIGSLYADKYGMEIFNIRIGNVTDKPHDVRRLAIWMSERDCAQLVMIGLENPEIKCETVFGMSDNVPSWWDNSNALRLGYKPQDRSADYAEEVYANHLADTGNPLADSLHGGAFATDEAGGDPSKTQVTQ